jgi:hypothetical protein
MKKIKTVMSHYLFKYLFKLRNFMIKNFGVCIIGFKKKDSDDYIWVDDFKFKYLYNIILQITPFIIIKSISNYNGYNVIYKYDDLYDITGTQENHILPIILNFEAFSSDSPLDLYDLTDKIKYFNSSLPFNVFCKLNIPQYYDIINIRYLSKGKICNKQLKIIEIKNNLIYSLYNL